MLCPTPSFDAESLAPESTEPADDDTETQTPSKDQPSCADPEASWGHRRGNAPGQKDEAFYGYYLQAATTVRDENGPEVPELTRRIHIASCHIDPPASFVPVLARMTKDAINIADVLSGLWLRLPRRRRLGAASQTPGRPARPGPAPNDQGTHGTHQGAVCHNGSLYCPATPKALF